MANIWVLVGEDNTRKSSTVRALTGMYSHGQSDIERTDGQWFRLYVYVRALQEAEISADQALQQISERNTPHHLIPLRLNDYKNLGDAKHYVDRFVQNGHNIVSIILLGTKIDLNNWPISSGFSCQAVPDSRNVPTNNIAARIRAFWGWR